MIPTPILAALMTDLSNTSLDNSSVANRKCLHDGAMRLGATQIIRRFGIIWMMRQLEDHLPDLIDRIVGCLIGKPAKSIELTVASMGISADSPDTDA